jgi:hypothetical protein
MKGRATLENPLLYKKFLATVERLNPDIDIDPEVIDRTMEYDEALNFLKEIYPNLRIDKKSKSELEQFREYLDEKGIDKRRVQNLIIQDDNHPYTEDDLNEISYALHGRPEHAVRVDRAMKAPLTKDVRKWAKKPNRLDLGGIDRPGAQDHHLKARINILADLNACSIKRACGTPEGMLNRLETSGKYQIMDIDAAVEAAKDADYF